VSLADDVAQLRQAAIKGIDVVDKLSVADIALDEVLEMVQGAAGITPNAMEVGAMIDALHDAMTAIQQRTMNMVALIELMADRAGGTGQ